MVKKLRSTFDLMWCKFCDYQAQSGKECPLTLRAEGCKECTWKGCGHCDRPEYAHLEAAPETSPGGRAAPKRKRLALCHRDHYNGVDALSFGLNNLNSSL
jgi:hypothetical protein